MSPLLTGFTSNTPTNVLVDAGVLYVDSPTTPGTAIVLGASVGGFTFDPGKEFRETDFDGHRAPVVAGQRITGYQSIISGEMLEFADTTIPFFEPGATKVTGPPIVFTPKAAGSFFAAGDYVTNLWLFLQRGVTGYEKIALAKALCRKYQLISKDKDEVHVQVEFLGCVLAANLGDAPYKISQETALPA